MDKGLRDGISKSFPHAVASDDALLAECVSMCQLYNLKPEDLFFKVEAFNYRSSATYSEIVPITLETLGALKAQIQRDMTKDSTKRAQTKPKPGNTAKVDRTRFPQNMARNLPSTSIKQEAGETSVAGPSHIVFRGPSYDAEKKKSRAYHYMYEKILGRSEALDQLIEDFADLIQTHYGIPEFADPSSATDEEVTIIGRLTQDSESASAKLTELTLTIESSRAVSNGARVPLRFDSALRIRGSVQGAGGIGLFPGAIVALKGKNGGGGYFLATEVLSMPPLKASPASCGVLDPKQDPEMGNEPISICVVCGPYTSDTDLNFKPWRTLLPTLNATKPNVLLLVGPFIDSSHAKIKAGDSDLSATNIFKGRIADPLRAFLAASPESIVLVVPSVRDLVSTHAVFPQPELDWDLFPADPRIHLLPNPTRFSINDISFAVSSVDVLFHLRTQEYTKRGVEVEALPASEGDVPSDAMANLCRHLLQQRSFYPLFPVPTESSHEVNLDVTHSDAISMIDDGDLDYAPDVLILPSRLKQFTKVVHTTAAINPSFLSKGSYATINIAGHTSMGKLNERLTVRIGKLEG